MNAADLRAIAAVFGHVEGIPLDEAETIVLVAFAAGATGFSVADGEPVL